MMDGGHSKRDVSEFNSAVSYLNRLNMLFFNCLESATSLDAHTWFHTLLALFRELSTEMKQKEIDEFEDKINKINTDISNHIEIIQRQGQQPMPNELYKELHEFEMELRKIMKEAGLQQKMIDDALKALK
jgi:hypothetical protein